MNQKSCCYCDKELTALGRYYVCSHCKTVAYTKDIPFEEKCNAINNFLDDVQEKINAQPKWFSELNKKHTFGEELTAEEQDACDRLCEFQSLRSVLKHETKVACNDNSGVPCRKKHALPCSRSGESKETIKKALYRLLMISDWLKEKFEIEE